MFSRIWLALVLTLLTLPSLAAPGSVIETKTLESTILRENRIGLNPVRRIKVYLPPGYAQSKARYPVIYMLHSINWDNERMFAPGTGAQPTFDRAIADGVIRPFIFVAPDYTTPGPGSLFANSSTTGRFEDHTLQEVIPFIDAHYRTLANAESRAITGDFMGAYGALRYAFRHPDVFSVVYAMHPVGTGSGIEPLFQRPDWARLNAAKSPADLQGDPYGPVFLAMIQTFLPNPQRPPLYCDFMVDVRDGNRTLNAENVRRVEEGFFLENIAAQERENLRKLRGIKFDWGRYDPTYAHVHSNREFTRDLDELGIEHEAEEFRGLPWDKYWNEGGRVYTEVLPFFARRLEW
jgi:S-formylglutathione hydrolase FrmB